MSYQKETAKTKSLRITSKQDASRPDTHQDTIRKPTISGRVGKDSQHMPRIYRPFRRTVQRGSSQFPSASSNSPPECRRSKACRWCGCLAGVFYSCSRTFFSLVGIFENNWCNALCSVRRASDSHRDSSRARCCCNPGSD